MATTEKTYEMMWDCEYCSHKKLLGVTHRHCPNCGGPQNPAKRYFPPESEKIAVQDHVYVGADVHCPSCQQPNARAAQFCGNCGGPLQGGQAAKMQQEQVIPDGATAPLAPGAAAAQAGKGSAAKWVIIVVGLVVLAIITLLVLRFCITRDAGFKVTGHAWKREIVIERYEEAQAQSSCKSMPSNATRVSRHTPSPVCTTRKVDNGDGTYKEKRECSEPEPQCEYYVTQWHEVRTEKATGNSVDDTLRWPDVQLRDQGNCLGCERKGAQRETYTVKLVEVPGHKEDSCDFTDESKWRTFKVGSAWIGKVGLIGGVDCGSLKPGK